MLNYCQRMFICLLNRKLVTDKNVSDSMLWTISLLPTENIQLYLQINLRKEDNSDLSLVSSAWAESAKHNAFNCPPPQPPPPPFPHLFSVTPLQQLLFGSVDLTIAWEYERNVQFKSKLGQMHHLEKYCNQVQRYIWFPGRHSWRQQRMRKN